VFAEHTLVRAADRLEDRSRVTGWSPQKENFEAYPKGIEVTVTGWNGNTAESTLRIQFGDAVALDLDNVLTDSISSSDICLPA